MPLPFILAGAAIAAAGYGAKKGYDGYQDKEKAERIVNSAKQLYDKEKNSFDKWNEATNQKLTDLGTLQIEIGQDFTKFRDMAKELLAKLAQHSEKDLKLDIPQHKLDEIKALEISTASFLGKAVGGLAGGAAAAYAVYGGVMALGAASTGTSIAALSGAAAYNATLAAIGGGSLAAGGFGMAGGAAILGGVVAAPVIAIAGWAYASHAEEALKDARRIDREVDKAVEKMRQAKIQLGKISKYTSRIYEETKRIYTVFSQYSKELEKIHLLKDIDYKTFELVLDTNPDGIIKTIENGFMVASILTDIITTPLFKVKKDNSGKPITDENGVPTFQTDSDGQRIVNEDEIDKSLGKADDDLNKI